MSTNTERPEDKWHLNNFYNEEGEIKYGVNLNVPRAWDLIGDGNKGHKDVRVAIIDTGIDIDHPSLRKHIDVNNLKTFDHGKLGKTLDPGRRNPAGKPIDAHGTAMAGIIAADDQQGVSGIAPGCKILPIRLSNVDGEESDRDIFDEALDYVKSFDNHINIVLLAGYWPESSREKIEKMTDDYIIIAPSGNKGTNSLDFPASAKNVISVGAVNDKGFRSTYSQYGADLDLVAPSNDLPAENLEVTRQSIAEARERALEQVRLSVLPGTFDPDKTHRIDVENAIDEQVEKLNSDNLGELGIATTDISGPYGYNDDPEDNFVHARGGYQFGGTSAAAAEIAGVVALMLSARRHLGKESSDGKESTQAILEQLKKSSSDSNLKAESNCKYEFGKGLVDCEEAVRLALDKAKQ